MHPSSALELPLAYSAATVSGARSDLSVVNAGDLNRLMADGSDFQTNVLNKATGFVMPQAIRAGCRAGVFDLLWQGPSTPQEILAGCPRLHPDALRPLLGVLVAEGFLEHSGNRFQLTEEGACLAEESPESLKYLTLFYSEVMYRLFAESDVSITTGESAFPAAFGKPVWKLLAEDPEMAKLFNRAMAERTRMRAPDIVGLESWRHVTRVADIGGGTGTLLVTMLKTHPHLRGTLFDRPAVVEEAPGEFAGIDSRRWSLHGGDFFKASDLPTGCDAHIASLVIHDYSDERAGAIIENIARATVPGNRLFIAESLLAQESESRFVDRRSDFMMLVGPGGKERTLDEVKLLLSERNFTFVDAVIGVHTDVIEAVRSESITIAPRRVETREPALESLT
jgi:SAM-dependent methyltransferase